MPQGALPFLQHTNSVLNRDKDIITKKKTFNKENRGYALISHSAYCKITFIVSINGRNLKENWNDNRF